MKYRLGTRKSALAQTQSNWVRTELEKHGVYSELVIIESEGDKDRSKPLYELEPESPGLFTKQLEEALLSNEIDLAVHSLKDLPTTQPPTLKVGAIPKRADSSDCLLIHESCFVVGETLHLPKNAKVGTSSLRREAQLLSRRPDFQIEPVRGNLPTRVRLVQDRKLDAIVMASAGIDRLNLDIQGLRRLSLNIDEYVPAPGQGALAVEVRTDADEHLLAGLKKIHDETTATEVRLERAILKGMLGGCTLPLGVKCRVEPNGFSVRAFIGISKDRKENKHVWKSFHHFDFLSSAEQQLVSNAIEQLKGVS